MFILGIESSCDETAASIVKNGIEEIGSSLASSSDLHQKTGGVVPEVAARKQLEYILPVIDDCFTNSQKNLNINRDELIKNIDAIAITVGPGLMGSLIVGVEAAKALSLALNKPLIAVNHLVGHIYGNFIKTANHNPLDIQFPALVLIVSGGHTDLVLMKDHGDLTYLGGTIDDAAGEAFDKTARLLDISKYKLSGPLLSKAAAECTNNVIKGVFPRPLMNVDNFDFSFSGLKTAVKYFYQKNPATLVNVIAKEFEDAVVEVLVYKTLKAALKYNVKSVLLGGGVSANLTLRNTLQQSCLSNGLSLYVPPINLCTDNAVYIASAAFFNRNYIDVSLIKADPSLSITDKFNF